MFLSIGEITFAIGRAELLVEDPFMSLDPLHGPLDPAPLLPFWTPENGPLSVSLPPPYG